MAFQLEKNHILFTSSNDVKAICSPLNKHFAIEIFSYVKINPDLSRIHLESNAKWSDFFYRNFERYLKDGLTEAQHWQTGVEILYSLDEQACVRDASEFNIGNGIVIANHSNMQTELVYFALAYDTHDSELLKLISNQDLLQKFIPYFREKASQLITKANKNPITLPFLKSDNTVNQFAASSQTRKSFLNDINHSIYPKLTPRELICLRFTADDMTAKEIARSLNISYRTVEKYICSLKSKLQCKTKAGLISIYKSFYSSGYSNY